MGHVKGSSFPSMLLGVRTTPTPGGNRELTGSGNALSPPRKGGLTSRISCRTDGFLTQASAWSPT